MTLDDERDERRTTLMWEAKALPGRGGELLAWALACTPRDALLYRSADRVVVIIDDDLRGLPAAPPELLARPAHAWRFERVR